jgi:hypothetical protein
MQSWMVVSGTADRRGIVTGRMIIGEMVICALITVIGREVDLGSRICASAEKVGRS